MVIPAGRFIFMALKGSIMPAKKRVKKMAVSKGLNKVDGHLWGLADAMLEHADNVSRFGQGTLKHEGDDLKSLAQELREFLEKTPLQRRKVVAGNLRYYNRYVSSKK